MSDYNFVQPDSYEENDRIMPLDVNLKSHFEKVLGADLSHVRIHTGLYSDQLTRENGAFAVTVGNEIYFANGQYSPETVSGIKLLAHELLHVVQYSMGRSTEYNEDIEILEAEADVIESLYSSLFMQDISEPLIDESSFMQIDPGFSAAPLKKEATHEDVSGLDTFKDKSRAPGYTVCLPSNKTIELSADEYETFKMIVKEGIIEHFKMRQSTVGNTEWDEFVMKFYNYLRN